MTEAHRRSLGVAALVAVCGLLLGACGAAQPGLTATGPDQRTAIALTREEARHLRRGMRIFLESVQGIIDGANRNDMRQVAASADRSGMGLVEDLTFADVLKLPPEFVALSLDTHQKFAALARTAREGAGKKQVMEDLGWILTNCTACHASYRLSR